MDELLDKRSAAQFLGVSVSTLNAWRFKGIGPKSWIAPNGKVVYTMESLEQFVVGRAGGTYRGGGE